MNGTLYYDEIEKKWYINWLRVSELYPSISVSGRLEVEPNSVLIIELKGLTSGDDVLYIEEDHKAKIVEVAVFDTIDDLSLYSQIEHFIISWNIDGTKTAGTLTRQIMELIEKNKLK